MKKHFWKIEYSITLLVLIGMFLLLVPVHFENYIQARYITQWKDKYNKISYMFNVINTQVNDEMLKIYKLSTPDEREKILIELIKPHMRLSHIDRIPWRYRPKHSNGTRIPQKDEHYFKDLYFSGRQIVGIKDVTDNDKAWFMMMFDLNGLLPPNKWGRDIFGIYVKDEGKIIPFGYEETPEILRKECSREGKGLGCSYYYLIGGELHD